MTIRFIHIRLSFACVCVLLFEPLYAQTVSIPSRAAALEAEVQANTAVTSGDYASAIPHLQNVLAYINTIEDPALLEKIRPKIERLEFVLSFCFVAVADYSEASQQMDRFIRTYPTSRKLKQVLTLRAHCEHELGQYEKELETLQHVLSTFTLPPGERLEMIQAVGEAYANAGQFVRSFQAFRQVMDHAREPSLRMTVISSMLETILQLGDANFVYELVPLLQGSVSPAKYSLQFNLNTLQHADQLMASGNPLPAFVLLKLCRTMNEISDGLASVQASLELRKRNLNRMGNAVMDNFYQILTVEKRLQQVRAEIAALAEENTYDEGLSFRIAQALVELDLHYEAYWAFMKTIEDFPRSENIPQAYFASITLASDLGLIDRALNLGNELISNFPHSERVPDVALNMAYMYQEKGDTDGMYTHLQTRIDQGIFTNEQDLAHAWYLAGYSRLFADQFDLALNCFDQMPGDATGGFFHQDANYWRAYIEMFTDNYADAIYAFQSFINTYPNGAYTEDATFRLSLAYFGSGDMENAQRTAEYFIEAYPNSPLRGEAYNLLGDIYGSLGWLDKSIEAYGLVELFTDDPDQVHTAVFNAAKVMEADGRWADIVNHFYRYLNRYGKDGRVTLAVYKLGEALLQQGRVDQALSAYWKTILRFANDPKAIGIDFMLRDYVADFQRLHIQKVMSDYKEKQKQAHQLRMQSDTWKAMTQEEREAAERSARETDTLLDAQAFETALQEAETLIVEKFQNELNKTPDDGSQETKRVRLLYGLDFAESPLTPNTYFTEEQVAAGSPLTLDWMSEILQKRGNHDLAAKAYQRILDDFPETDSTVRAHVGLGELALAKGHPEEAYSHFETIYEYYPSTEDAGTARMRMADIHAEQNEFETAIEMYEEILLVREWRGPLWPEALYKLGEAQLALGHVEKAFAYFQRVYVLYRYHLNWTAKAYLASGICLERMDRKREAAKTYREMLDDSELMMTPEGLQARQRLNRLPQAVVSDTPEVQNEG